MNEKNSIPDILIIGGGIHGMHMFHLMHQLSGGQLNIKIADPHPEPLCNWEHCTSNTGMKFLRSPGVHHLDIDPFSLHKFCEHHHKDDKQIFISPNSRPALALFNQHSKEVFSDYSIQKHWLQTRIRDMDLSEKGVVVHTDQDTCFARHVILAIGSGRQLTVPAWADELEKCSFPVHHIYSHDFSSESFKPGFHTVVIGGGMGAVQLFTELANTSSNQITLVSPSPLSVSQYDIEPGWMGPKYLDRFSRQKNYRRRRSMIESARKKRTITPDVERDFKKTLKFGHARHMIGKIKTSEMFGSGSARLTLENGQSLLCDQILLGTGFGRVINNELIQTLSNNHSLCCADCGYPIVDPFLRWHSTLSVTGELAELELGPAAKNIIGARHAGERIRAGMLQTAEKE